MDKIMVKNFEELIGFLNPNLKDSKSLKEIIGRYNSVLYMFLTSKRVENRKYGVEVIRPNYTLLNDIFSVTFRDFADIATVHKHFEKFGNMSDDEYVEKIVMLMVMFSLHNNFKGFLNLDTVAYDSRPFQTDRKRLNLKFFCENFFNKKYFEETVKPYIGNMLKNIFHWYEKGATENAEDLLYVVKRMKNFSAT